MIRKTNESIAPSQTLDRGLAVLEAVALADRPMSTDDVVSALGLHRSVVYRLLRTLEDRRLVERGENGSYNPGAQLAVLARSVRAPLREAAGASLAALAEQLEMTAFLVVRDGEEAVTIDSIEPRFTALRVAYRPGTRHPLHRGAPGLALLAGLPFRKGERREVTIARRRGWASTQGEVIPGMAAIAAPIGDAGALAVLWLAAQPVQVSEVAAAVMRTAGEVANRV